MPDPRLERILDIVVILPEAKATTRTGQHYALEVRGKKFCYYTVDHHGDGRVAITYKAPRGLLQELVAADPVRYFTPPYMAQHGWVGLDLDVEPIDWDAISDALTTAYRMTASKSLATRLGSPSPAKSGEGAGG
ncbi:MAG: MmcQ/YjbR family DNA-binding protein [Dehalococcoidia bacterium]